MQLETSDMTKVVSTTRKASIWDRTVNSMSSFMALMNVTRAGTPRHERSDHDLSSITEIITKADDNINPLSIHDLLRLGKYQEQSRHPRTIYPNQVQ